MANSDDLLYSPIKLVTLDVPYYLLMKQNTIWKLDHSKNHLL
jgi:hypothetical protein